tara:strand:+ start:6093 stop:6308 length:216 start_codon:yes stop_codon:yes gene_type:complete
MLKRHQPEVTLQETAELLDKMQGQALSEPVMLALIREQLQIHNTTQRHISNSLHDINNSIQALASAVRNLE